MKRRPLLAVAAGFALGTAFPTGAVPTAAAAGLVLALSPATAPLAFGCAGWIAASAVSVALRSSTAERRLEGRVVSVPDRLGDRVRFVLREADGSLFQVTSPQLAWPVAPGDRLRVDARLRVPEGRRNPGGRDRAAELRARGIASDAFATAPPVRIAPPAMLATLEAARDRFAEATLRSLPPREAGLVRAIGTGDRSGVDTATADAFARSGLAHLLSVSGLHLAIVALGTFRALRWALSRIDCVASRVDPRRAAAAAGIPLAFLYALATGGQVPVVRSAIAAAVGFIGILLDRELDALNVLSLAALAILATDPASLLDVSFQLSFASVAGLALGSGPLRRTVPLPITTASRAGRAREAVLGALCASVAATVATAPLVAFHFRRLSIVGILSNIAGVPVGSALTIASATAALVTAAAPAAGGWLLWGSRPLASLLLWVNDLAASLPWGSIGVGSPGWIGVALFYGAVLVAWRLRGRGRWLAGIAALVALIGPPHLRHALASHRGGLEITFLSVGQGDATALLLPDGSAVLVDGGGEANGHYDPGARDVVPWLRDAGVTRIAAVFLSHPHPDHLLGLPAVMDAFRVEHFFTNGRRGDDAAAEAFARLPPPERFVAGDVFERAGVRIEGLGPSGDHPEWTENDASLVLRVVHGSVRILLPGDIEAEGEASLVDGPQALEAEIVKIPHHGSGTSSGPPFVAATRPTFAIACVGHENRFSFPNPDIVSRWTAAGALVLRTDAGAVRFLSDGRAVRHTPAGTSHDVLALARERL